MNNVDILVNNIISKHKKQIYARSNEVINKKLCTAINFIINITVFAIVFGPIILAIYLLFKS